MNWMIIFVFINPSLFYREQVCFKWITAFNPGSSGMVLKQRENWDVYCFCDFNILKFKSVSLNRHIG